MKKLFLLVCILSVFGLAIPAVAQYEKGDLLINPGVSLFGYNYGLGGYYNSYSASPALSLSVDYNLTDNISLGGYLGYQSISYKHGTYKDRRSNTGFGARGIFHATEVLNDAFSSNIDSEKWDFYGGVSLGYEIYTYRYDDNYAGVRYDYSGSTGGFVAGIVLGTRYMFTPKIGAFAELGRGAFGALTIGATFKL